MSKRKYHFLGERTIYVILGCSGERIDESEVEAIDISEDIQGRDVLIFRCPECGARHTSLRFG